MKSDKYSVKVEGLDCYKQKVIEKKVLFHAVNKSGSGALSRVLRESFIENSHCNRFISPYFSFPKDDLLFKRIVTKSIPPIFFLDHYLYRSVVVEDPVWLSMVRHPLPRILSVYGWLMKKHSVTHPNEPFVNLEEFIIKSRGKKHTQMAQFAFGFGRDHKANINNNKAEDIFEIAMSNIDNDFLIVGVSDYLDEFLFVLHEIFDYKFINLWAEDTRNLSRPKISNLSTTLIDLIYEVYKEEFKFFDNIRKKFLKLIEGVEFSGDYLEYKRMTIGLYKERQCFEYDN